MNNTNRTWTILSFTYHKRRRHADPVVWLRPRWSFGGRDSNGVMTWNFDLADDTSPTIAWFEPFEPHLLYLQDLYVFMHDVNLFEPHRKPRQRLEKEEREIFYPIPSQYPYISSYYIYLPYTSSHIWSVIWITSTLHEALVTCSHFPEKDIFLYINRFPLGRLAPVSYWRNYASLLEFFSSRCLG